MEQVSALLVVEYAARRSGAEQETSGDSSQQDWECLGGYCEPVLPSVVLV